MQLASYSMHSVSRVDDEPPDMDEAGPPTRLCGYVCTSMWYLIACIVMPFFYRNNAWLIVRDPSSSLEFQRGLNDDCLRNTTAESIKCASWDSKHDSFPAPFDTIVDPPIILYLSLYIARALLLLPFVALIFSVACCCNEKCEKFAKEKAKIIVHILAIGAVLFIVLFLIQFICLMFLSSTMKYIPQGFDESFGLGFYGFVVGGFLLYVAGTYCFYREEINAILVKRFPFLRQPHHPISTDAPPVSMRSINQTA